MWQDKYFLMGLKHALCFLGTYGGYCIVVVCVWLNFKNTSFKLQLSVLSNAG